MATREANFTWSATLPESNELSAGTFWPEDFDGPVQISMEEGAARNLGIEVGDEIGLTIAGESVTASVTSLRYVAWDSFQPNFYLMLSPGFVEQLPQTYLSSVHVPDARRDVMNTLEEMNEIEAANEKYDVGHDSEGDKENPAQN